MSRTAFLAASLAVLALASGPAAASSAAGKPSLAPPPSQGLHPSEILKPEPGSWPTYSGDYSGQRHSPLTQINKANVKDLKPAFKAKLSVDISDAIIGGVAEKPAIMAAKANVRGSILQVDGVLYVSAPDHAWAVDARTGKVLWHYFWKTKGGTHIGNRGMGMWGNYLYLETPDNYLISLDAKTGKERWAVEIASFEEQYFSTTAPIVVGDHVLVGTGNDLDMPGFLQSFDPVTGERQWKFYTVPMKEGDPGLETWKDLDTASHGGGNAWVPGSYDPETNLYIIGTGNPSPAYFPIQRGDKDALFTCSMVAIDVETGKMKWYYQTSPNDSHDWDSAQTPILADIEINGKMRKVAMQAARNGYYFTVDRVTGEHLVTGKFSNSANWAYPKLNAKGQPVRIPAKDHHVSGALVSMANGGAANWQPAAYSPQTELFYVHVTESWAMYYLTELDPRGGVGLGGKEEVSVGGENFLKAIDPKTGKIAWQLKYPSLWGGGGGSGLLTTAGGLLFGDDAGGNLVARDATNGKPLWHVNLGWASNATQTYMLDGKQYILVASGDTLNAFTLP
jgi:alcohol dehydrogenase (cytochrome c)